ncbi:MAG: PilZ domain-containing protein [Methylococcales bacterium]|nr:PilZ domain-containing protein [Methylococcales bacterium]MBT7410471.1 PilZ domain-containing protein [Methylococcales bacterium]
MDNFSEKRNYIRMYAETKVEFRVIQPANNDNTMHTGISIDISGDGVQFTTDHLVEQGNLLDIKITPEKPTTPPLDAEAEVIRVIKTDNENEYSVATKFTKIKPS